MKKSIQPFTVDHIIMAMNKERQFYSNSGNRALGEYYQNLADVIGVFWQFHKKRLDGNNITLTYNSGGQEFDFDYIRHNKEEGGVNVLADFDESLRRSLTDSWLQYIPGIKSSLSLGLSNFEIWGIGVPEELRAFMHPYVGRLIEKAQSNGRKVSQVPLGKNFSVDGVVRGGMKTGTEMSVHLASLFGEDFKISYPLMMSKLDMKSAVDALEEVGIATTKLAFWESPIITEKLKMIDLEQGISHQRARYHGYGVAIGCPANILVSSETSKFLMDQFGISANKTMLAEYVPRVEREFKEKIWIPYQSLTRNEKEKYVIAKNRALLDGDVLREVEEYRAGCPYSNVEI